MNFDRIAPEAAATAAAPNWVEEIATKIAKLKQGYDKLAAARIFGPERNDIEQHMQTVLDEMEIAELMLSTCYPATATAVLIVVAATSYRISAISTASVAENQKDTINRECSAFEKTFAGVIPALEKIAGVTVKELGIEDYHYGKRSIAELVAAAEKAQEVQENGKPQA